MSKFREKEVVCEFRTSLIKVSKWNSDKGEGGDLKTHKILDIIYGCSLTLIHSWENFQDRQPYSGKNLNITFELFDSVL